MEIAGVEVLICTSESIGSHSPVHLLQVSYWSQAEPEQGFLIMIVAVPSEA